MRRSLGTITALGVLIATSVAHAQDFSLQPDIVSRPDGSATFTWDTDAQFTGSTEVITSNPSIFTGPSVAPIIGANQFHSNGYTGANTITLNVEAGHIWGGHETLTHVTSFSNAAGVPGGGFVTPAYDRHATWVGMMIGGRQAAPFPGTYQEGIAPNTTLRSGAIATSWNGSAYASSFNLSLASLTHPYDSVNGGFGTADVINSSWGATGGSGSTALRAWTQSRSLSMAWRMTIA